MQKQLPGQDTLFFWAICKFYNVSVIKDTEIVFLAFPKSAKTYFRGKNMKMLTIFKKLNNFILGKIYMVIILI